MSFRGANRAQALQVGAILLFGFLIIGLSLYQATVVPEQNRGVEFNAYQEAAGDMIDLRNDVIAVASHDSAAGTSVKTGVNYPSRAVFVNPGPPDNQVRTTDERNMSLDNVAAIDSEAANTRLFIEEELNATSYVTRDVEFRPRYNVFDGQPMVVTGQQAYRHADGTLIPMSGQSLLQGDRLTLTFVDGDLAGEGDSTSITTDPVSASQRTVTITGENNSEPLVLRMESPPGVTAQEWVNQVGATLAASNARVEDAYADGGTVVLELDPDRTYQLRMAKVETRERGDSSSVGDTEPAYLLRASDRMTTTASGESADIEVEVRDEYNNPKSGVDVNFELQDNNAGTLGSSSATTDEDGVARVTFTASAEYTGVTEVAAESDAITDENLSTTEFAVNVIPRGEAGEDFEPRASTQIFISETSRDENEMVVTFRNEADEDVTIERVQFSFYFAPAPGRGTDREVQSAEFGGTTFVIGGQVRSLNDPQTLPADSEFTTVFEFYEDEDATEPITVENEDFVVVTIVFDDGVSQTYFISPSE